MKLEKYLLSNCQNIRVDTTRCDIYVVQCVNLGKVPVYCKFAPVNSVKL